MNNVVLFIFPLIAVAALMLPCVSLAKRGGESRFTPKKALVTNISSFIGFCILAFILPFGLNVMASPAESVEAAEAAVGMSRGLGFLAAALSTGLSSLGAGIAVAAAAPAAIGAFSENPKAFGKSMIFVALGEGVAIYGVLVSILIMAEL